MSNLLKNFEQIFPNIDSNLNWYVSKEDLYNEFFWFLNAKGVCTLHTIHTKIIKYFQQDKFFEVEKEMWKDDLVKIKIIKNRIKYLNKTPEELTTYDILSGFKKSALHYGYSGFNPLLAKWFYEKYNCHICYDPCGGWGHRMLGSTELDKYIYNDLSKTVAKNVETIKNYFDFFNTEIHCEDARTFIPKDNFDSIFTCPPYFNLEHYECGDFENEEKYYDFLDCLFKVFETKESCKVFGMVMREDLIGNLTNYSEKIEINSRNSKHFVKNKKYKEYLYIYKK